MKFKIKIVFIIALLFLTTVDYSIQTSSLKTLPEHEFRPASSQTPTILMNEKRGQRK